MKRLYSLLLVILVHYNVDGKKYEDCELARELFEQHKIPIYDIPKHLCITNRETSTVADDEFLGLYAISRKFWCSENEDGGGCNVNCSSLTNDDITDDVLCGSKILKGQGGLSAWGRNVEGCRLHYEKVTKCLRPQIVNQISKSNLAEGEGNKSEEEELIERDNTDPDFDVETNKTDEVIVTDDVNDYVNATLVHTDHNDNLTLTEDTENKLLEAELKNSDSKENLPQWAIIVFATTVTALTTLLITVTGIFLWYCKCRSKKQNQAQSQSNQEYNEESAKTKL